MKRQILLPLLSILGLAFGIFTVVRGNQPEPVAPAATEPARPPYASYISGAGIVEASTRNLAIGASLPGIVKEVRVQVGDQVHGGDTLFVQDDREARAELSIRQADLARARAGLGEAAASQADANSLLILAEAVSDRRAISTEELARRRNALLIVKARVESNRAQVLQAEAAVAAVRTTLERLNVRAPLDGEVLQVNLRPGEYAPATPQATPLLVMGDLRQLHVRVDIDENDAWRFHREGHALGFLRGNPQFHVELQMAYVEPFVVPKRSLTGDSSERVDTRVLQVLYRFDRESLPVYVGQQMDVFIEAPEVLEAKPVPQPSGQGS